MREILFRGKNPVNGEWFYGSLILEKNAFDERLILAIISDADANETLVNPETVGQYTGLTDKNGTRIFEGDVVKLFDIAIGEIVCEYGAFGISCRKQIDYDYLASEIASVTGCDNKPRFCHNDNFVSLWELYWNYNQENSEISVIEVIGNVHDGGAYD